MAHGQRNAGTGKESTSGDHDASRQKEPGKKGRALNGAIQRKLIIPPTLSDAPGDKQPGATLSLPPPLCPCVRWGGGVLFGQYANALGWSLAARRLVERGDLCIAQSAIVQTDIIEAAVEPMRHMKPAPTNGGWHARLGRD